MERTLVAANDDSNGIVIAPSILDSDLTRLGESVNLLEHAGADFVHLDVMDGCFVPNISIGVPVVASVRKVTSLPLDVHLMIDRPERYVDAFIDAGADILTIHYEATLHPHRALQAIREHGVKAGLALNPGTPVTVMRDLLELCDMILLMSVNPGFGGQQFIPRTIQRLGELDEILGTESQKPMVEVDGGVNAGNAREIVAAGANVLVAGSAVFRHDDGVAAAILAIRESAAG
jgi:ribulose-phosphate 3-epimerase